ncbi:MAG: aspartyl protease family protein [Candidatus Eremiobacteraeota bacterium]|nr:aspartyl protease family protein [Candidatus Eremiobacteraeota bacterium]
MSPRLLGLLALACLYALPVHLQAQTPDAATILANYQRAHEKGGAAEQTRSVETQGTLSGEALNGTFHTWRDQTRSRVDQQLGVSTERSLRVGDHEYIENSGGNVRELHGLLLRRSRTRRYVDSGEIFKHPQASRFIGEARLPDGRNVYRLEVQAPQGEPETIAIDKQTWLLDRVEYIEGDGPFTIDLYDYHLVDGALLPFRAIESDGDHAFDVTQSTTKVRVNQPLPADVFAPFPGRYIEAKQPQTVPLVERQGHLYASVVIHGHAYSFLVDSGAQSVVVDSRVAAELSMFPEGALEARGSTRTGGLGVARLDTIHIADANLYVGTVSVLDLGASTGGAFAIDGILGYPFFAASVVRIDYANKTMTFAPPGMLSPQGKKIPLEVDRALPEVTARVNSSAEGPFLVDTGDNNELLLFAPFVAAHPGMIPFSQNAANGFGIGGSTQAMQTIVDQIEFYGIRLFNRYTAVIQSTRGAFADRYDAGNIGLGILKNFTVTFDENSCAMFLSPGPLFDDGQNRRIFR